MVKGASFHSRAMENMEDPDAACLQIQKGACLCAMSGDSVLLVMSLPCDIIASTVQLFKAGDKLTLGGPGLAGLMDSQV